MILGVMQMNFIKGESANLHFEGVIWNNILFALSQDGKFKHA